MRRDDERFLRRHVTLSQLSTRHACHLPTPRLSNSRGCAREQQASGQARRLDAIMGNCFGTTLDEPDSAAGAKPKRAMEGPPAPHAMTPQDIERRELARKAAEERARQNAVRGTQRQT